MEHKATKISNVLVYGIYSKLIWNIQNIDSRQTFFRLLTSSLLLGFYTIGGLLFTVDVTTYMGNKLIPVVVLSIFFLLLMSCIWYLDVIILERSLLCSLIEAHKLEIANTWLPDIHSEFVKIGYQDYKISKKVYFYAICGAGPLIIATVTSYLILFDKELDKSVWCSLATIPLLLATYFCLIIKITAKLKNKIIELY